jgi:hypothetical protein
LAKLHGISNAHIDNRYILDINQWVVLDWQDACGILQKQPFASDIDLSIVSSRAEVCKHFFE